MVLVLAPQTKSKTVTCREIDATLLPLLERMESAELVVADAELAAQRAIP